MDRIGPGLYNVYRGAFTTCESDEPEWAFKMGSGTVALGDVAYGQNASFWLTDKVPLVPWVPFFAVALQRERQSGFLLPEYGSSNKKGFTLKVPYFWAINDSMDLTVSLDTFTRWGLGIEGEFRYVLSQQNRGTYSGFFVSEFLRSKEDRERLDIPENRGYFSYRHDWQITPSLSFKIDANATTDDQVLVSTATGSTIARSSGRRPTCFSPSAGIGGAWWATSCGTRTSRTRPRSSSSVCPRSSFKGCARLFHTCPSSSGRPRRPSPISCAWWAMAACVSTIIRGSSCPYRSAACSP
jgi:hypothetical protein